MDLVGYPPYQGPMPDVSGDTARYEQQYAQRYPQKSRPRLHPDVMQQAATNTFRKTGTTVPTELALTQAQFETDFGNRGVNAENNPFNIGVYDDKTVFHPRTQLQGVQSYYNTMANDYLDERTLPQLMDLFVNEQGNRYASDKDYEKKIKEQIPIVRKRMK